MIEGGVTYLIRTDFIGRPAFATNLAGTKVWSLAYLPFGGVTVMTGAPADARFPGQWFQAEAGLYQNWMRDYDPTTGRYLEADPLGLIDGASIYGYVRGNPGRWTDPRGEDTLTLPTDPSGLPGDWALDPVHLDPTGQVFKNACSEARLSFHYGTLGTRGHGGKNHWHFNPSGDMSPSMRYRHNATDGRRGRDYLLPGDEIEYCGCEQRKLEAIADIILLMMAAKLIQPSEGGALLSAPQMEEFLN